ncbi:hypothetical protein MKW92_029204, partial [Papaver armeniacum]
NRDSQGWLSLTVKQLSDFNIDGVRLVGILRNKMESVNGVTFMLDDKTSKIDCYRRNGTFAEIHRYLKGLQGEKHLEACSVRPVTDIDQVAYRFRECMCVHCRSNKSQMTNAAITNGSISYQTAPANQICWQPPFVGINQKVLDFLSIPAQMELENGVHLEELAKHLKVPPGKIKEALATLVGEGAVFPTIDRYHYKAFEEPVTDIDQVASRVRDCHITESQGKDSKSAQPQMTNAAITNRTSSKQTAPSNQIYWQPTSVGINQKVLDFLSIPASMELENGVHLKKLAQHFEVPLGKIKEAVATLEEEGAVFPTIDRYHYKAFEEPVTDINWQATLAGIGQKVLDFLCKAMNMERENGVHLKELFHHIKVPREKIMEAVRYLEEDGMVYSTIDEFHYKSSWTPC